MDFRLNDFLQMNPGFRFEPTDQEIMVHYLQPKIQSLPLPYPIPEADVCGSDPWNLPGDSQEERYFLCPVETKHPNGTRTNRTTPSGRWKPTNASKQVVDSENKHLGTKKTFVFYMSKPGSKTDWFMHEYKIANPIQGVQNWMICRVFLKNKVRNTGAVFYVPRDFDLNLDGGDSSSTGFSGVTVADDEDEINSK
ncbi:putative transcription factor NAM family [Helianthus annuus]|uniref:Transcription factor NAM family n=1 Tax=Helianthus annuus TaxID=4232 RepID=A0A9K3DEU4_HELAN|nr:NAC domain-containing protein 83 [Helianthus annuus]KAF5754177.1 putative transcription factor NAM family [Helianthus annuus]KAJ0428139.1 putative transcription factor NAM family [Helianthus annuus]KAJ0432128.1 putative transcription factor NAM family [Helianthus annuus]KAJ0446441.1 putative transcription factor NAM family [Helianthus annuus]KAJ0631370.1 putative transcription factor NAM family [Helianthus annuus]